MRAPSSRRPSAAILTARALPPPPPIPEGEGRNVGGVVRDTSDRTKPCRRVSRPSHGADPKGEVPYR